MTNLRNKKVEVKDFASLYYGYIGRIVDVKGSRIIVDFWPEISIHDSVRTLRKDQIRFLGEL